MTWPKGKPRSQETIDKIKETKRLNPHPNPNLGNPTGYRHTPERIEKIRAASKGRTNPQRKGKTLEEYLGKEKADESNRKRREKLKGRTHLEVLGSQERVDARLKKHAESMRKTWEQYWSNHHPEIRDTTQYYEWRKAVLTRDNFTCQHCEITKEQLPKEGHVVETNMHTHHIKSWKEFVDLRYVVENGLTPCPSCHRIEETRLAQLRQVSQ